MRVFLNHLSIVKIKTFLTQTHISLTLVKLKPMTSFKASALKVWHLPVKFISSYRVKILLNHVRKLKIKLEVLKMSNISINYINYDWLKYFKYFNGVNTSDYSATSES